MKINKISTALQKFAQKTSQNPKLYDKLNNKIFPISETVIGTSMYALFIEKNNNLEKERKPALHYQNLISGGAGIFLSSKINHSIQKHQNNIIDCIRRNSTIKNPEQLINGLKIAMPVIIFTSIIRFLLPIISTPISSKISEIKSRKLTEK